MNYDPSRDPVFRVLHELYGESRINAAIIQEVLGMARRTAFNRMEGITQLRPGEILELSVRLGTPRLLNAWLRHMGYAYRIRPVLTADKAADPEHIAQAEVRALGKATDTYRRINEILADSRVTHEERAEIHRMVEELVDETLAVPLGVLEQEEALV